MSKDWMKNIKRCWKSGDPDVVAKCSNCSALDYDGKEINLNDPDAMINLEFTSKIGLPIHSPCITKNSQECWECYCPFSKYAYCLTREQVEQVLQHEKHIIERIEEFLKEKIKGND